MSIKKVLLLAAVLLAATFVLAACAGPAGSVGPAGPAGPVGPAGPAGTSPSAADLTCTQCHNNTNLITAKQAAWSQSLHGSGLIWFEDGSNISCAPCHSGSGFLAKLAAGQTWDEYAKATDVTVPDPTPQDCRACHKIHTTYTKDDFALQTTAPVAMVVSGQTFDKGLGNLCVNCHQSRRAIAAPAADGTIAVTNRFGPHHGPQSDMLLGVGGAGAVSGSVSPHYTMTTDACVTCHMGDGRNHAFTPAVTACVACHADAKDFDTNGAVTALAAKIETLKGELTTAGLLDADGNIVPGNYAPDKANALWNYLLVAVEDKSQGVHNMSYAEALVDASLAVFGK